MEADGIVFRVLNCESPGGEKRNVREIKKKIYIYICVWEDVDAGLLDKLQKD